MNLYDIMGPVMVGPSSSHTAGAVRIGLISRKLLGEKVQKAEILFHGSFFATGIGHGTDRAVIAGLLGMAQDDLRIPKSLELARKQGMEWTFGRAHLKDVHPNSVKLCLTGESGRKLEIVASSPGGGRVEICQMDGLYTSFSGDMPVLIVHNQDSPGHVSATASLLADAGINIASMRLSRDRRNGSAVMVLECDQEIPEKTVRQIEKMKGIQKAASLAGMD